MMRRGNRLAVAVRLENGEIALWPFLYEPLVLRCKWLNIPIIRGLIAVFETLSIGYKALAYSANVQLEAQGQKKVSGWAMTLTFVASFALGMVLLIILPSLIANALKGLLGEGRLVALADGMVRIVIIFGYILGVSALPRIGRYFEYHGAEHRSVAAFEAGQELSVENVQKFSSFHPRCGTSLVGLVVIIKFLVLPLFGWGTWGQMLLIRFLSLPIIVGVAIEAMKAVGKYPHSRPLQWLLAPGMWLQRLTARVPTDDQVEVAIKALKAVTEFEAEEPASGLSGAPAPQAG